MHHLTNEELLKVTGGESIGSVLHAAHDTLGSASVGQSYQSTVDFIANHPFFHQGLMDKSIGGGAHFRNVPFIGPGMMAGGALTGNPTLVAKGFEVTRGTLAAK